MDEELNDSSKSRQKVRNFNCVGNIRIKVVGRTESTVCLLHHIGARNGRRIK